MGRITRGIIIYDVWAGSGAPVANPEYGITVETWASRDVAIMTITEDGNKFAKPWDTGYNSRTDMRSYPKTRGGAGGSIKLLDDGWYNSFISAGYSLEGSRVSRTWNTDGIHQSYIDKVTQGRGDIQLTLMVMDERMNTDATNGGSPLIVGNWQNAELHRTASVENVLFGGMTFRQGAEDVQFTRDEFGAPLGFNLRLIPTDPTFSDHTLPFPENTFMRVVNGVGKDSVFPVEQSAFLVGPAGNRTFSLYIENSYGIYIDNSNPDGIKPRIADISTIGELTTFQFYTLDESYSIDENSTIDSASADGVDVSDYTIEGGVLRLNTQQFGSAVIHKEVENNTEFDFLPILGISGLQRDGSVYYRTSYTADVVPSVDNKSRADHQYISWEGGYGGISYDMTEDLLNTDGVAFDCTIKGLHAQATEGYFRVVVVAVWGVDSDWSSDFRSEVVLDIESPIHLNSIDPRTAYCRNIGKHYFEDGLEENVMDAFDDRELSGSSYVFPVRGRNLFAYAYKENIEASPDKVYCLFLAKTTIEGPSAPILSQGTLKVYQVAFFGDKANQPTAERVTAKITGRAWANIGEAIENIATLQDWSSFPASSVSVPPLVQRIRCYVTSERQLKTSTLLDGLLREAWSVGAIDRDGTYSVTALSGRIGADNTVPSSHNFVLPHGYSLLSNIVAYESDDVPTGGTIQYNRDSAGGYNSEITVSNADADTYDSSYVGGVADPVQAQDLWEKCHGIWMKTGVLNDVRNDLKKLNWLYEESDAIQYFNNILEWNGGSDFIRDVRIVKIRAVSIDNLGASGTDVLWDRWEDCRITIPNVLVGEYTGIITGVKYTPSGYEADITMRVAQLNARPSRIVELDNTISDKVIELETNTDRYIEEGI